MRLRKPRSRQAGAARERHAVVLVAALLLVGATVTGTGAASLEQRSEHGHFTARISGLETRINRLHGVDLLLSGPAGPVSGAALVLEGRHRHAGNPLPTSPRAGEGAGAYRIDGLRFHIAGEWRLELTIELGQIRDRVIFDIVVE
jgi:hypothetical protein